MLDHKLQRGIEKFQQYKYKVFCFWLHLVKKINFCFEEQTFSAGFFVFMKHVMVL